MQASKIMPGNLYAIYQGMLENRRLVRFVVEEVITRRTKATGSPHDYKSTVQGRVRQEDGGDGEVLTLEPDAILGPYAEYAELMERAKAEQQARDDATRRRTDAALRVANHLRALAGLKPLAGDDAKTYGEPIRYRAGGGIDISEAGVAPLLKAFNLADE